MFHGTNEVYIGHNRSRTVGEANRRNAHPFVFDHIIGAHNGTLDNTNKNRLEKGSEFKTDSEALFNNIEVHGIKDTIGRLDKGTTAYNPVAYALTWYDGKDNSINFLRNDERPLWYVYANEHKTIFWASEIEILLAALSREGIKPDAEEGKAYLAGADTHLKWIIPDNEYTKLPDPQRLKYENKKGYVATHGFFGAGGKKSTDTISADTDNDDGFNWHEGYGGVYNIQTDIKNSVAEACALPQDKKSALDRIASGISMLIEGSVILKGSETKQLQESRVMSPEDFTKKRKFEESKGAFLEKPPAKLPLKFKNANVSVYRDTDTGQWLTITWDSEREEWERRFSDIPPKILPFTILHPNDHHFEHQGKKGNKRVYYKAFKKDLLTQESFNRIMQNGCINCERKDIEWGNEVVFLDHEHNFLCEHCKMTPGLIDHFIQKTKKVG